ncbi:MAG TPA: VWA domain-containing protein, partial [Trueperaceae bacterium]|nr:VWA domain-containing protein [Trueperaceae bacterium]
QVFVFDAPVKARYARLVFLSSQGNSSNAYLGEWKLIAAQDATFGEVNLAAPEVGGHVVTSDPYIGNHGAALITADDGRTGAVDLREKEAFTFVVGFHDGRAGQVTRLEWQEPLAGSSGSGDSFPGATVEVSLTGGAGPWAPLADWTLQRDAGGLATLQFEEPVWARYLKFTAAKVAGDDGNLGRYYFPPDVLRVFERAPDDEYRSALGEWGAMARDAVYEYLNPVTVGRELPDAGNDTLQSATPLESGEQVSGAVEVAVDEDWYRLTIPAGQNHLELTLTGDPRIFYLYELVDAGGAKVGFDERFEGDDVVLSLFADPGDYYLHLWEPKRTVVFSWDTSGSVSGYQAITYNSLASFAAGVNGEREAVQLLAFDDPAPKWLLPFWSSDPQRVQRSIVEFDRQADSSNSETALLTATKALADRDGTRAILLITDAESPSQAITSDLWTAFEQVRPRIFTFEISSGGSDYAQDLMQDWADVNSGVYSLAAGIGDFDAGFSRASCILRRPKRYSLVLSTRAAPLPGPGSLSVQAAPGAAKAAVEIVFDASGSMGKELPSGEQRITAAKRALTQLVNEVLPEETPFALRAFGHIKPSSCETRLDLPLAPLDRAKAAAVVQAIEPKLLSQTPIADSLLAVKDDLAQAGGARTVILITDGEESCGGDPAAAVRELRASGPVDFAIVSLGLEPEALAVFQALAADVGATYVDVGSFEALADAVAEALNPAFEVFDSKSGELVARGRVGGDPISLEMGVYDVRVLVTPVQDFEAVRVPGEQDVRLTLRKP